MNGKLFKSLIGLCMLILSVQSFAKVELSLKDLRKEVLNENLDIRIQYEKYYQSQKGVSVALGQFLPSANINLININATLAVLQSVVPTPTEWFAYQSSKELRMAEKFTTESIKLNILEGLTVNFVNIKHHEALMNSLKEQEASLAEIYEQVQRSEELGTATINDVFLARRKLLQHRQDIYLLNSLIVAEKQALLVALNKSPEEELVLGEMNEDHTSVIPDTVEEGAAMAINNSTELLSNSYQAEAAHYMVSSKRWSFLSFNGIGFDYSATLAIEKSKARVIALQGEQLAIKIKNQVYAAYEALDLLDQRIEIQKQVVVAVRDLAKRNAELYQNNAISFTKYYESKNDLADEERSLVKLEMEKRIKSIQLKRLLGLDASLNDIQVENYQSLEITSEMENARRGAKHIWVTLKGDAELMKDVFSVTYSVEDVIAEARRLMADSNMTLYFKGYKGTYKVTARIQLISGDIIVKEHFIEIK